MLKSKIKGYIELSKYTREELMNLMEVSRNTISNWSSGKSYPNTNQLFKLAYLLGVKVDDLYEYIHEDK